MPDPAACRVLIVDDAPEIRELLRATFGSRPGFEVVGEAVNGEDAVEQARRLQPDVVLLDIGMPVMDGLTALPLIRAAATEARVVVLSGFDSHADRARELGADEYVLKGVRMPELAATVRRLCPS